MFVLVICAFLFVCFPTLSVLSFSVERYDPSKDAWEMVAPMADKRINFGVGVMLGFIFVVGGHNGVSHLSSIERYDPYQNQWTACRPMSEPRTGECNRTGLYNSDIPSQAELVFNTALLTYLVKTEAEVQILSIRSAAYCLCFRPFSWQFSMLVF